MIGMLAFSKAGHDKDTVYVIVGEEKEFVYLSDGRLKSVEAPKKKNKRHIQIVKRVMDEDVAKRLQQGDPVRDEEIKKIIKDFLKQEVTNV